MTRQQWTIETIDWETNKAVLRKIRGEVFIKEQQVSMEEEWDGLDDTAVHFVVKDADNTPIGCARLLPNGQFGRMAILASHRRKGVGAALMKYVIAWCHSRSLPPLFLHAQVHAIPFYESAGFVAEGPEFMDANIAHREMRLKP